MSAATTNSPPAKGEYPEGGRGFFPPKLRFPEFREAGDWEKKTLEDACRMQAGKFVAASEIKDGNSGDLFPCYGGNGLRGYTATFTHDGIFPLIGRQGALCGNVKLAKGSFYATEHALVTSPKQDVHTEWLYYLLNRLNLNQYATGQAQPGLSVDVLNAIPIAIPERYGEQQKVADCLSSLDELIAAQARKVEALKTHKKGLMQQLFPCKSETRPRVRYSEFLEAGEWLFQPFDYLVMKSFYGTSSSTSEVGAYPVLRMGNMSDGRLIFSNLVYIDLDRASFEKIRLLPGDILMNRTNSQALVGKISMFDKNIDCVTASYIVAYRVDKKKINPIFCNLMLNTPYYQAKINAMARPSVSQVNINPTTFRKELIVSVPSLEEQQRISDCLTTADALIITATQELDTLKTHKKGLMQQLFPAMDEMSA